jgi:hypothetical protein
MYKSHGVLPTPEQRNLLQIYQDAFLKSKAIATVSFDGKESILGYFEISIMDNGNIYTNKFNSEFFTSSLVSPYKRSLLESKVKRKRANTFNWCFTLLLSLYVLFFKIKSCILP